MAVYPRQRKIKKLSWSKIDAYRKCPRLFKLRYIDYKKPPQKAQPLVFGIGFHEGVEAFLRDVYQRGMTKGAAISNAVTQFEYRYCFEGPAEDLEFYKAMGGTMLRALIDWLPEGFCPLSTEIFKNQFVRTPEGGFTFVGKIDCIAQMEDHKGTHETWIIDWKTSKRRYTQKQIEEDQQLTAYQWLTSDRKYTGVAFVVVTKENTEVQWCPTHRTAAQLAEFSTEIIRLHKEIETRGTFPGVHTRFPCEWCDMHPHFCRGLDDF